LILKAEIIKQYKKKSQVLSRWSYNLNKSTNSAETRLS